MGDQFEYAECARRIASKQRALEEGEAEQEKLSKVRRKPAPPPPGVLGKGRTAPSAHPGVKRRAQGAAKGRAAANANQAVPPRARLPQAAAGGSIPSGTGNELARLAAGSKTYACPHCNQKLVRVVCISTPVRICARCKGVWLPYCVVREFAAVNEWFQQLEPSLELQLAASRKKR